MGARPGPRSTISSTSARSELAAPFEPLLGSRSHGAPRGKEPPEVRDLRARRGGVLPVVLSSRRSGGALAGPDAGVPALERGPRNSRRELLLRLRADADPDGSARRYARTAPRAHGGR